MGGLCIVLPQMVLRVLSLGQISYFRAKIQEALEGDLDFEE